MADRHFLLSLVAQTTVTLIRVVGVILVIALLTISAADDATHHATRLRVHDYRVILSLGRRLGSDDRPGRR